MTQLVSKAVSPISLYLTFVSFAQLSLNPHTIYLFAINLSLLCDLSVYLLYYITFVFCWFLKRGRDAPAGLGLEINLPINFSIKKF